MKYQGENIEDVLDRTDFNDKDSILVAYDIITSNLEESDQFCAFVIDGGRNEKALKTLTALKLRMRAGDLNQSTAFIPNYSKDSLNELANLLSPLGEEMLLEGYPDESLEDIMPNYLAREDRWALTGYVLLKRHRTEDAMKAFLRAGLAYEAKAHYDLAGVIYTKVSYTHWTIAEAYKGANDDENVANHFLASARTFLKVAQCYISHVSNDNPANDVRSYRFASEAYERSGAAYWNTIKAYDKLNQSRRAAMTLMSAGDSFRDAAGIFTRANNALEAGKDWFKSGLAYSEAAARFKRLSEYDAAKRNCSRALDAFARSGDAYKLAERPRSAAKLYLLAAAFINGNNEAFKCALVAVGNELSDDAGGKV
ncbi:hypothetical protein IAG25_40350 [Caballeronia sp. EK]|uniref:hypothetical protein n=1 Tax=Caballeronia sp. EK TaxID=2767469 RepID=UPI001654FC5D|nr:hypothetical protein [Caballeronia sp. EK]MBC8643001.1 hypothetical protein [Caballeronia sp. EK]